MSKDKISDYSETPGNNTDIGGINIAEGMLPSDVNNAIREQMAQLKKFQSGTSSESVTFVTANLTTANVGQVNVDNLRLDGNTFSSTNSNGNIAITPNGTGEVDISKVDIDGGAIDGTIIGGASAAAITGTTITANTSVSTDTISEKTSAAGVTVDGVLLKDSEVTTDVINEKTSATGVTIDGVLLKDSQVTTDQINEKTSAAGVTIDGVLLKDSEVTTDVIKEKTSATGVTIDSVLLKDGMVVTDSSMNFRNRIINGAMMIDQRNAGASVTPTDGQYSVDRWKASLNVASKFSLQQSSTAPAGFVNSLLATSLSSYSVAAGEVTGVQQVVEGLNVADLAWGTASAETVTLSFWVRSSLTGTFGGSLRNSAANRSYPFTYTISAADTWEQKSVTIAGDTTGTWLTTNGVGIQLYFAFGAGSTYSATAGSWAAGNYVSATGATSVVGTNGATFYITGVQLEVGSVATPFERRPYGTELSLCQRYYQNIGGQTLTGFAEGSTNLAATIFFYQQMRAAPTCSIRSGNTLSVRSPGGDYNAASPVLANTTTGTNAIWTNISGFSGLTVDAVVTSRLTNQDAIAASAEL